MRKGFFIPGVCVLIVAGTGVSLEARSWRTSQIPNGGVFDCRTCHLSPGGGGARNAFGNAVNARVGFGSFAPFWNASLAALDSDGDGFTNGQELGDPDGDGVPVAGAEVTHPGDRNSKPAPRNSAPTITSNPITEASFGLPYRYQIAAQDADGNALSFVKVEGPAWLVVSSTGLVSGTPPENGVGEFNVALRVSDNGTPAMSANHDYKLRVMASFAGWQALRFNSPAAPEAAPNADGDNDGLSNLQEYLIRSNPQSPDTSSFVGTSFDANGRLSLQFKIRDDDPKASLAVDFSNGVDFGSPAAGTRAESDGDPADGFKLVTFTDAVSRAEASLRFARVKVSLTQ